MLHADTATSLLGVTHHATERDLRDRVPSVMLRNGWYLENYTAQLPQVLHNGALAGATGQGRISAATRADYAAAAVLTTDGYAGQTYELGGDEAFTLAELAATISAVTGKQIAHVDLPADRFTQALTDAGLPPELAHILANADLAMSRGELFTDTGDLRRLIARPTVRPAEAITAALS
jgi:NAD(P)H dehydrogenase (quinone)